MLVEEQLLSEEGTKKRSKLQAAKEIMAETGEAKQKPATMLWVTNL